jgi:hypothetical protein
MMPADVEGEAAWLYTQAKADPLSPPSAERFTKALGIKLRKVDSRILRSGHGATTFLDDVPTIWIRRHLSAEHQRFVIMHEIAEVHLRRINYRDGDIEHAANAIAGALVAPRPSFREAVREHGELAFEALAHDFTVTQTCAALRLGEVIGTPLAVITPLLVRVRGDDFVWPDEFTLRRLARCQVLTGLRKVALSDEKRRTVLLAA